MNTYLTNKGESTMVELNEKELDKVVAGASAVEYGLLASLIVTRIVTLYPQIGVLLNKLFPPSS